MPSRSVEEVFDVAAKTDEALRKLGDSDAATLHASDRRQLVVPLLRPLQKALNEFADQTPHEEKTPNEEHSRHQDELLLPAPTLADDLVLSALLPVLLALFCGAKGFHLQAWLLGLTAFCLTAGVYRHPRTTYTVNSAHLRAHAAETTPDQAARLRGLCQHVAGVIGFLPHGDQTAFVEAVKRGDVDNLVHARWQADGRVSLLLRCEDVVGHAGAVANVPLSHVTLRRRAGRTTLSTCSKTAGTPTEFVRVVLRSTVQQRAGGVCAPPRRNVHLVTAFCELVDAADLPTDPLDADHAPPPPEPHVLVEALCTGGYAFVWENRTLPAAVAYIRRSLDMYLLPRAGVIRKALAR
jgi:hypothetical protein